MDTLLIIGTLVSYIGIGLLYVVNLKQKSSTNLDKVARDADLKASFETLSDAINDVAAFAFDTHQKVVQPAKKAPAKKAVATKAPAKKATPRTK